jgi:uncharacterized membrane protein YozB (DUF420 family)
MTPETVEALRGLLPTVNASLNGLSAVLLVLGYVAVRSRRIGLHKACMLGALAVSAVFLGSYLFYHFGIIRGQHVSFRERVPEAPGWLARVYLAVLLSHTVLAVVAAPLALVTAYLGLRDRIATHRRVARWTLPIWLYVSVTGVVVYWMLYRLYPSA